MKRTIITLLFTLLFIGCNSVDSHYVNQNDLVTEINKSIGTSVEFGINGYNKINVDESFGRDEVKYRIHSVLYSLGVSSTDWSMSRTRQLSDDHVYYVDKVDVRLEKGTYRIFYLFNENQVYIVTK